ncbi:DUF2255 family protein [Nakamurella sp. YIM 132087]|uniref:DUF2255 family protein n=1 Tax=Nakamurella alba TaxID=2665158 RepID=A0A7K1FDX3_9ACTN|nr:DUF2255 family protein [Nakamurella alba]MTD12325.1 DUF2255 family protein [Nakamurella alba]
MASNWTADQLTRIADDDELRIRPLRADGTPGRQVIIWAVVAGGEVYVRTWQRRDTGWYGRVVASGRATVDLPDGEIDVTVEDVGGAGRGLVDDAYRSKYHRYGTGTVDRMVGDDAADSTLRLLPTPPREAGA